MTDDVLCCICKGRHDYIVNGQEHPKFNFLSEPLNHPNEFLLCAHCDNGGHSSCLYGDIRRGYFDTYLCREHAKLHVVKSVGDSVTHVYYKDDLVWVISEIDSAICWVKAQIFDFTCPSGGDVCAYVRKVGGHMCALGDRNQVLIVKFCELRPRDSEGCAPSYDMVNRQFQDLSVLVVSRSEDSVQCIYPCDPACLSEFMSDWVRTHSAQRCNDGGLGVCKPKKPKSRRRVAKDKEDGTAPHRTGSVPEVEVPVQEAAELVQAKKSQSRRRAPKAQSGGSASQVAGSVPTVEVPVPDAAELVQARRNFRAILETNAQNAFKNQRGNTSSRKLEASPKDEVVLTGTMASHFSSLKPQIFVRTGVKNRSSRTKGPHKPADDHSAPSSPSVLSSTSTPQKPKSRRHARVSSSIEDVSPFIEREAVEDYAAKCDEEDTWLSETCVVPTEQGQSPRPSSSGRVRSPVQSSTPEAKAPLRDGAGTKSAAVNNSPATGSKRLRLKHAGSSAERNALAGGTVDGNTNGDSKQLYAATDAGVKYSIDGDPQFVMAEDAAARAQFCMAEDKEFRKAEAAAARLPLEVTASLEESAGQQPSAGLEFCSKLPVRATAVRNAVADLNVSQYALANVVVRCHLLLFRENLSVFFADAKRQTHKQRRWQHGLRSQACNSFCLGGRGRLPSCWPFGG